MKKLKNNNLNLCLPLLNKGYEILKNKQKIEKLLNHNKQQGVSLVSVALATAIGIGVIISGMWAKVESSRIEKAELQGEILRDIATGLNNYIVQHHRQLLAGTPITKTENGVEIVIPMGDPLRPTISELEQLGLTKAKVGTKNLYGGDYIMQIEFKPNGCVRTIPTDPTAPINSPNCDIEGVVAMTNPIMSKGVSGGDNDSEKLAGYAIKKMGSIGGFSSRTNPSMLVGIGGSSNWSFNNPNGAVAGILAAKTNYTTSTLSYYLPRDGHLPMTDDLKLGEYDKRRFPTQFYTEGMNNSIKAVDTIEARYIEAQDVKVERDLTVGRHITAGDKTKIGQADQSLFNFYGKMNIGDENANISDAALLNVYGRTVLGKKGQAYTGKADPLLAVYGDTNIGELGNSILFKVFGDSEFNGYSKFGGTAYHKTSQFAGAFVNSLNNQVVMDVDGNAAFNDSVGINKYLYVGNGVGKRSQIANADKHNDKVNTTNSVLDVNGNAVIGNNLKVLGSQLVDTNLYVSNYTRLGVNNGGKRTELNGPAANALNQRGAGNVALDIDGNAMVNGSVGINKYLFVGDGTGQRSAIPGVNQNTIADINGGLGVKDDAQILGNVTIGTGNFGDGNKGNLNVSNKLTAYDAEIKRNLIAGSPGRGSSTFYNQVTFAENTQTKFKSGSQTIFEPGSYIEFQGKVRFDPAVKPKYADQGCQAGEFTIDDAGYQMVCRNGIWDWAEPDGSMCGLWLSNATDMEYDAHLQKVMGCRNIQDASNENGMCPKGYVMALQSTNKDIVFFDIEQGYSYGANYIKRPDGVKDINGLINASNINSNNVNYKNNASSTIGFSATGRYYIPFSIDDTKNLTFLFNGFYLGRTKDGNGWGSYYVPADMKNDLISIIANSLGALPITDGDIHNPTVMNYIKDKAVIFYYQGVNSKTNTTPSNQQIGHNSMPLPGESQATNLSNLKPYILSVVKDGFQVKTTDSSVQIPSHSHRYSGSTNSGGSGDSSHSHGYSGTTNSAGATTVRLPGATLELQLKPGQNINYGSINGVTQNQQGFEQSLNMSNVGGIRKGVSYGYHRYMRYSCMKIPVTAYKAGTYQ